MIVPGGPLTGLRPTTGIDKAGAGGSVGGMAVGDSLRLHAISGAAKATRIASRRLIHLSPWYTLSIAGLAAKDHPCPAVQRWTHLIPGQHDALRGPRCAEMSPGLP